MQNSTFGRALDAHFDRKYADLCDALDEQGGEAGIEECEPEIFEYGEDWY